MATSRSDRPPSLARAADLRRQGRLSDAAELLARRLADAPGDVDAQHLMARVQLDAGRPGLACLMLSGVEVSRPDDASVAASLARALAADGDIDAAARRAGRALALSPSSSRSHRADAYVAVARGDVDGTVAALSRAVELDPSHLGARIRLAEALFVADRREAARDALVELAERDDDVVLRISHLAVRLVAADRADDARAALETGSRLRPGDPELEHLLAAQGAQTPERASDEYVRRHFDRFADSFDDTLDRLGYTTPTALAGLAADHLGGARAFGRVLDLGCGTGLAAAVLRPAATALVGVDLSPRMLERARARAAYDELHVGEAGAWCLEHPDEHDLVFAADVLNYFGAPGPILTAIAGALRPEGHIAASYERHEDVGTHMAGHGRWSHGEATIRAAGDAAGLELVAVRSAVLRHEAGNAVDGLLVLWRRPAGPAPA